MVVELFSIEHSGKGNRAIALTFRSHIQETLIRTYRARLGGSNGALCIWISFVVVELMAIEKGGKGSRAIAVAVPDCVQV
jgi:hypothetical protein